jgi:two-component system NtrC family sensor kinase
LELNATDFCNQLSDTLWHGKFEMKLAFKLVSILVLEIIFLLAIDGYLSVKREIKLFDTEMKREALQIGHAMKDLVVEVWHTSGQRRAMKLIKAANKEGHLMNIRWVWLDASPNDLYRPRAVIARLEPVRQGQEVSFKERGKKSTGYRYTYVPVAVNEDRPGALELSEPLTHIDDYARSTVVRTVVLGGILMLISSLVALLLGVWMLGRPLHRIIEKVRRVGSGELSGRLDFHDQNELSELARALNAMCDDLAEFQEKVRHETAAKIEALEQLRHADRLRTVGRLASGVAHELGTPLNVVSGRAGLIAANALSQAEVVENATIIKAQSERMTTIIQQLLDFARRRPPQKTLTDIRKIVDETLDLLIPLCKKSKVKLVSSSAEKSIIALVDAGQIQQVLTNLIVNALQAMPQGGKVEVGIRHQRACPPEDLEGNEGAYICIDVRDEGLGVAEKIKSHLFEPFFSTKYMGKGTGLGLSIAYGIVRDHGGWIDVKSTLGKGSCFSAYLLQEADE